MAELFGWKKGAFTGAVRDSAGQRGARGERHALHRRDRQALAQGAGGPAPRAGGARATGRWARAPASAARTCASSSAPTRTCARPCARAASARISTTASTCCRVRAAAAATSGRTRSRSGPTTWCNRRHREQLAGGQARLTPRGGAAAGRRSLAGQPAAARQHRPPRLHAGAWWSTPAPPAALVLAEKHVARALDYEQATRGRASVSLARRRSARRRGLRRARRASATAPSGPGPADALQGLVLGHGRAARWAATRRFRLLGRESLVKNRNHHKALKRELEKVEALYKALGEDSSPFTALLTEDEAA